MPAKATPHHRNLPSPPASGDHLETPGVVVLEGV
jgi:hypothetical protein